MNEDELLEYEIDEYREDEEFDYDYCYECSGYGDDYYYDEEIDDWVCRCFTCVFSPYYDPDCDYDETEDVKIKTKK